MYTVVPMPLIDKFHIWRYQGSSEGSKWLLTKYLGSDKLGTNLHYAKEIASVKKWKKQFNDTTQNSTDPMVKWKVVAFFPLLTDQEKTVASYDSLY